MTSVERMWWVTSKDHMTMPIPQTTTPLNMLLTGKLWNVENERVKPSKQKQKYCAYVNVFLFYKLF